MGRFAVVIVTREAFMEKATFEQSLEESEGTGHSALWRKNVPGGRNV